MAGVLLRIQRSAVSSGEDGQFSRKLQASILEAKHSAHLEHLLFEWALHQFKVMRVLEILFGKYAVGLTNTC